jgi:hypothetical protein
MNTFSLSKNCARHKKLQRVVSQPLISFSQISETEWIARVWSITCGFISMVGKKWSSEGIEIRESQQRKMKLTGRISLHRGRLYAGRTSRQGSEWKWQVSFLHRSKLVYSSNSWAETSPSPMFNQMVFLNFCSMAFDDMNETLWMNFPNSPWFIRAVSIVDQWSYRQDTNLKSDFDPCRVATIEPTDSIISRMLKKCSRAELLDRWRSEMNRKNCSSATLFCWSVKGTQCAVKWIEDAAKNQWIVPWLRNVSSDRNSSLRAVTWMNWRWGL